MSFLRRHDGGITLTLHVQPGAKRTEWAGLHGEAIKLRLAAPPVDGKANAALLAFMADYFGVAKSAVSLLSGETSRHKIVRVTGAGETAVAALPRSSS
ncbi:MAG: DUF167 family protein [Rhodocyclaceae bacterium]